MVPYLLSKKGETKILGLHEGASQQETFKNIKQASYNSQQTTWEYIAMYAKSIEYNKHTNSKTKYAAQKLVTFYTTKAKMKY